MAHFERKKGAYSISTNPRRLDRDAVHRFLSRESFWAQGIPKKTVATSMKHSLCFGLFDRGEQIGFARVVTDRATYAYLCDVYVLEDYRGKGLGTWLMKAVMSHPDLQGLRRFQLVTRDAHRLYERVGFRPPQHPERHLEIFKHGMYVSGKRRKK